MRLLVLALLFVNAGVLAWQLLADTAPRPPVAESPGNLSLIVERQTAGISSCFELGPLEDAAARTLERQLSADGFLTQHLTQEQYEPLGYWVYLPPARSLNEAQALGARLRDAGITDYVLVAGSEKANAISLGLFQDSARAAAYTDRIRELGFQPHMEQRYRRRPAAVVRVAADVAPALPRDAKWRQVDCTTLAGRLP